MMGKLLSLGLAATTVISNPIQIHNETSDKEFIRYSILEEKNNDVDVVVRNGEWYNPETGEIKPGKRVYINSNKLNIPNDIPIRYDSNGTYIHEYDINLKLSKEIHRELLEKGVHSKLQISNSESEDLNAAGRIAKKNNSDIYLSIHHNYHDSNSSGYFFMADGNDLTSTKYAQQLSDCIKYNPSIIPQRNNQLDISYVGELLQIPAKVNILGEFGFALSNEEELLKCINEEQINFIAEKIANELVNILNEID